MSESFNQYRIERISKDRLKDLLPLRSDTFGGDTRLSFYQKKFATQFTGVQYIGYIAYDKYGKPAAYYGLYPCNISYNDKIIRAAVSGDTMTHSSHRGKGLFVILAKKTFESARVEGVQFAFGFPNQNSYGGSIKAGWSYNGEKTRLYTLGVKTFPFAKIFRSSRWLQWLYKRYAARVFAFYPGSKKYFPNSLIEKNIGGVLHDGDFFKYKSFTDNKIVKVAGVNVWLKAEGELKIGDVEKMKDFPLTQFLNELKNLSAWLGCTTINFLTTPETWLDNLLSKHFTGKETFLVARIDLGCEIPIDKIKFSAADFDTF